VPRISIAGSAKFAPYPKTKQNENNNDKPPPNENKDFPNLVVLINK
jgi:hypothetical protein